MNRFKLFSHFDVPLRIMICLGLSGIFSLPGYAQRIGIKGCIVEETENMIRPVGYANVTLTGSDSIIVTGTSSNENGMFHIKDIGKGSYSLSISFVGYDRLSIELENLSASVDLGNIRITPSPINLNEVTVSASHYVNQIDRKIIFPDEKQIKKSTDGMDLLRNLQLSGIDINRPDNSITGARGGKAEVRINGIQVTHKEVLGINPKDIIRIEYHDEPSLRYGDSEIVIDYILRRRETGGSIMVYGQKGMPGNKADGSSIIKMNHRKSEFKLLGGFIHSDYGGNYRTNREDFAFPDGSGITRIEEGLPDRKKNHISSIMFGYCFVETDKHHFNINIGANLFDQVNHFKSLLYQGNDRGNGILMVDHPSYRSTQPFTNFYYQLTLKNQQMLVFDVAGYYSDSKNRRNYIEKRQDDILTGITTNIDGYRYWVTGEGFYEKKFKAGRLNTGIKHTRIYQENNYSGDFVSDTETSQATTYFYTEWMGRIKRFSYAAGIGGTQVHLEQGNDRSDHLLFTPAFRLGYQFNDQFRIRYTGRTGMQSPAVGDMNPIEHAIDSLQVRRGNPLLEPAPYFHQSLTVSYDRKHFSTNLLVVDHYSRLPLMERISEEKGKFIHMMENHKGWHQLTATGYIKVTLLDRNLNMKLRGGLNRIISRGNDYHHTLYNWFMTAGIDYTWKKWNPFWDIGTRKNDLSGETISYSGQSMYFGLRYKPKYLSMSVYFKHSIGWESGRRNLNQYASDNIRNYSPDSKNMLLVDFIWNLRFGKRFNSQQKKINNSDSDAGMMDNNR